MGGNFSVEEKDFKFEVSEFEGAKYYRVWPVTFKRSYTWLKDDHSQPFFLWINYMGTHWVEQFDESILPEQYRTKYSSKGQFYDGNLFDLTMRIPLVIRAKGIIQEGIRIKYFISSTDIMPSMLEILNIKEEQKELKQSLKSLGYL